MQKFNKHIIQSGETLKSIANLYGISESSLKLFHNNHCKIEDQVLIQLNKQKELFLPRTAVSDKNKLVKFGHGNRLLFQPENSSLKYSTMITIEKNGQKNELRYDSSVRWIKSENGFHFFEIDRISDLFINEEQVNEIADLLAYKTSKVLFPMQISVDQQGKFNNVESTDLFKERWKNIKDEIYKEFEGDIVDEYCQKIEKVLEQPNSLFIFIKNDYFIRTLFFGIYKKFNQDYQTEMTETFPVVNNAIEPSYKIEVEIDPLKDEDDLINIAGTGKLYDERSRYDFSNGAPFSLIIEDNPVMNDDGNFRLKYYLNGETQLSESLYLECDINLESRKKVSVVVTILTD
ncbi:LysM peptidoglycan-binding domain-containing protein [Chryseobacterium luquanense]|uniref:LysM peptidoglycan-binding domain-containing protein n=1 Tax=Chryseobacterium luquanense TaxID=2983766 RepID=A0ABT3Y6W4_9FLAO|nr:LysM domain-containing protein [Chryseobacterium luquanense]MCX8533900.1 LysM peptidoglycan-binding domain-containing protein [Chryseobacterium luquanense]